MWTSSFRTAMLAALSVAIISGYHSSHRYIELEALGVNCPSRDRCDGYRSHLTYMDRSCECDSKCAEYRDCCIDAPALKLQTSRPAVRTDMKCLHYGEDDHTGVYAISKCRNDWTGPRQIREKCLGSDDFADPLAAAPVTDVAEKKTYRNLACAECNYVNTAELKTFRIRLICDGLSDLTEDVILGDLTYSRKYQYWGVHRFNRFQNTTDFIGCDIVFDVPDYLNNSVRFCRSNIISKCAPNWRRPTVARLCSEYMTVIYSNTAAYRNPHCAICNHLTVDDITCKIEVFSRKRPMSFALLLDVNQSDGNLVGMRRVATPECPSNHKYDPFFKKCRQLVCALPGYVVANGRCVDSRSG